MAWEWKTLDQLGSVSRGRSKHRPRDDESLYGGIYPFIQTADVKRSNFYITEYSQTYNERGLAQSKLWRAGTLCFTIAANIADSAILGIDACFPDSIMGFIPYEGVSDVRFVKYCFDVLQQQCKQISQGATQDNLSWEKLSTIKFPAPDYKTQQKIADILSAYDNLIENNQKQIKLLEEAAQRIYKQWFIDLRFPGHETIPIIKGLPEGWRNVTLGDVYGKIESGSRPKGGIDSSIREGVVSVGAENVLGLGQYNYSSEKLVSNEFYENAKRGKIEDRDILVYKDGAYIGRTSLFQDDFPRKKMMVNEHVFLVNAKNPTYQYFLFFTLNRQEYFDKMQKLNKNSAQPGINRDALKSLEIIWPADEIVMRFDNFVAPMVQKLFALAKQNYELSQSRDRLLPKLMNGEIEV